MFPEPPAGYPDRLRNARSWHFGFNHIEELPETLIQGREREFLQWFFGPFKCTRTWCIEPAAFAEYLRVPSPRMVALIAGLAMDTLGQLVW